jgi:hypothetical protein
MARVAKNLSIPDLKRILEKEYVSYHIEEEDVDITDEEEKKELKKEMDKDDFHKVVFMNCFKKDLEKVEDLYCTENSYTEPGDGCYENKVPCGFVTLENGFSCLVVHAGGDGDVPVIFIIYFDGKKLRAYVPKLGNPWNWKTKELFPYCGEVCDDDNEYSVEPTFKQIPNQIVNPVLKKEFLEKYPTIDSFDFERDAEKYIVNWNEMKLDIINRIKLI